MKKKRSSTIPLLLVLYLLHVLLPLLYPAAGAQACPGSAAEQAIAPEEWPADAPAGPDRILLRKKRVIASGSRQTDHPLFSHCISFLDSDRFSDPLLYSHPNPDQRPCCPKGFAYRSSGVSPPFARTTLIVSCRPAGK